MVIQIGGAKVSDSRQAQGRLNGQHRGKLGNRNRERERERERIIF